MDQGLSKRSEEIFSDIYIYDKAVEEEIEEILKSPECTGVISRARTLGSALPLLDEIIPDSKNRSVKDLVGLLYPFYRPTEYRTKDEYLSYLKQVYGFMMTAMEVPPGRMVGFFFPKYKKTWSPSPDFAYELLEKFYVEFKLLSKIDEREWKKVADSANPEAQITQLIYGTKFKPDFEDFLRRIPWIASPDKYGTPGLDIIYRRAPGHKMPKKPFGVGERYLKWLVESNLKNQAHTLLSTESEKHRLREKGQIEEQIESQGAAYLDSFMGISKIERDFVIHQEIVIWRNPGFEKYQKASLFKRLIYARPPQFLCAIKEEALPLEIPFIKQKPRTG